MPLTVLIFTYINIITIARSNRNNVNQQPRGYFGSLTGHDVEERNTYSRSWNNLVTSHAETAKDIVISTTEELSSELLQKGQSKNEELDGPTRAFQQSPQLVTKKNTVVPEIYFFKGRNKSRQNLTPLCSNYVS